MLISGMVFLAAISIFLVTFTHEDDGIEGSQDKGRVQAVPGYRHSLSRSGLLPHRCCRGALRGSRYVSVPQCTSRKSVCFSPTVQWRLSKGSCIPQPGGRPSIHHLIPAFISFRHISAVRRSWRRLPPSRSTGRTSLTGRLPTSRGGSLASTGGAT